MQNWRALLLCSLCFGLGLLARPAISENLSQQLAVLLQAQQVIASRALQAPPADRLMEAATEGLVTALQDPYSSYLNADNYAALQAEKSGEIVGLGLELAYRQQQVFVMSVLDNTPAAQSRLRPGDRLLKINGQDLSSLSWAEVNARLSGAAGDPVQLEYLQQGQVRSERLIRQVLRLEPVRLQPLPAELCYLRITTFLNAELHQQVKSGLESLPDCSQGLILDLQNNPGGLVQEAVEVGGLLGVQGVIVQVVDRRNGVMALSTQQTAVLPPVPMVVLINQGTASAAEILAAALQESGRALLMGQTSFGKGRVQSLLALEDGAGLSLTSAHYLTRRGEDIHQRGLTPDIPVISIPGENQALEQAVRYLRRR